MYQVLYPLYLVELDTTGTIRTELDATSTVIVLDAVGTTSAADTELDVLIVLVQYVDATSTVRTELDATSTVTS
jgi:hypothetical protein